MRLWPPTRRNEAVTVGKHPFGAFWPKPAEPFRAFGARLADWPVPASDATSGAAAYRISRELPGVTEADIGIRAEAGTLTIRSEQRASREQKGETRFVAARQQGPSSAASACPPMPAKRPSAPRPRMGS